MKLSVSLGSDDVRFLDAYAEAEGLASRSAALQRAVGVLKASQLGAAYEAAWDDWSSDGEERAWEPATSDGLH